MYRGSIAFNNPIADLIKGLFWLCVIIGLVVAVATQNSANGVKASVTTGVTGVTRGTYLGVGTGATIRGLQAFGTGLSAAQSSSAGALAALGPTPKAKAAPKKKAGKGGAATAALTTALPSSVLGWN